MDAVIFGRSPFINKVDVLGLMARYTSFGCNHFGEKYPVNYLFSFDDCVKGKHKAGRLFVPSWSKTEKSTKIHVVAGQKHPFKTRQYVDNNLSLAFQLFTPSLAINYAILEGFKNIYLVGIDHIETDKQFKHHDGIDRQGDDLQPTAHQLFKEYVYNCAKIVNIYQTNPAIQDDWALPFKSVRELIYG